MGPEQFIKTVSTLVAGLQMPVSLSLPLGTAREPWEQLHRMAGFGWHTPEDYEKVFKQAFKDFLWAWLTEEAK